MMSLDESQDLLIAGCNHRRQSLKQRQDLRPASHRSARQLSDNKGMAFHASPQEKSAEVRNVSAKVLNPDGCVNEHGRGSSAALNDDEARLESPAPYRPVLQADARS